MLILFPIAMFMIISIALFGPFVAIMIWSMILGYDIFSDYSGWLMASIIVWWIFREWGSKRWSEHNNFIIALIFARCGGRVPHEWW